MEFTFVTDYDQKALTTLAKVLRKTTRRTSSIISRVVICGIFVAMMLSGILFMLMSADEETMMLEVLLTGLPCPVIFLLVFGGIIIFDDYLVGFSARKHMQPGTEKSTAIFSPEGYISITNAAKTEFRYDSMSYICETTDYFVFVMGKNHGLIFSKRSISGGTVEDFRGFVEERTNKKLLKIKG